MHVLIAPDALGTALGAPGTGTALAAGWARGAPHDSVEVCPLSAGGRGLVGLVAAAVGVRPGDDGVLLVPGTRGSTTAYIEAHRYVDPEESSLDLARSIERALDAGAGRVVVGLPGPQESGVPDAGAGLLTALGALAPGVPGGGPDLWTARLGAATTTDLDGLAGVRERLRGIDLVGAAATDVPLLGLHGASAGAAAAGALDPSRAHDLERAIGHFAHQVREVVALAGAARSPLALVGPGVGEVHPPGAGRALTSGAGTGAGGGLGFALCALGGRVVDGAGLFAAAVGLRARAERADLVLTACGDLDGATFHGSPTEAAVRAAGEWGVPCVAVAGTSLMSRRERAAAGLNGVVTVDEGRAGAGAPGRAGDELERAAERLARTWSPARALGPGVLGHS